MPCVVTSTAAKSLSWRENAHIMLEIEDYAFSFWIVLFEADYAKNYASILYQCLE